MHCIENNSKTTILYIFDYNFFYKHVMPAVVWIVDVEPADEYQLFT